MTVAVYNLTDQYPKHEIYGLVSQTRRAAVSIPSNIAEGRMRGGKKEFCHFLFIAYASGGELETQLELARRLPFGKNLDFNEANSLLLETMKMLNKMLSSLRT